MAQRLLPVCNVFNEKTVRRKIIKQQGGESRLVFDHQDPWLVEIRCAATPHKDRTDNSIKGVDEANIFTGTGQLA
jgi:hypothetical protein